MNSETQLVETEDRAEAVAAWTMYFEADLEAARERVRHMGEHGISEGHIGEWLGANLALTPRENRCAHFGDDRYCPQCLGERLEAARARRADADKLKRQRETIERQSEAIDNQSREIRRLRDERRRLQAQLAARQPRRRRLFGGGNGAR